jgi:DNA-binding response OmpR family regulator
MIRGTSLPAAGVRYRALVVEDDPAIRRLVERLLARKNIDIDAVADGEAAVSLLGQHDYSVVILDLMVPGLDGFAIIDNIRLQTRRPPVAVVSAVSHQALTKLDLDIVKIVISKPFDVDEFTKAVLQLCADAEAVS